MAHLEGLTLAFVLDPCQSFPKGSQGQKLEGGTDTVITRVTEPPQIMQHDFKRLGSLCNRFTDTLQRNSAIKPHKRGNCKKLQRE